MKKKKYEEHLEQLAVELVEMQRWQIHTGKRIVMLFEGRDAAGKGGVIKAITEFLDTRHYRIVALSKPTEQESTQWYYQRYIEQLPSAGEIVLFDRSWYNRAGVEHVMGFCSDREYHAFLQGAPTIERGIVESGIILIKYWFEVSQEIQSQRFQDRIDDGRKIGKL